MALERNVGGTKITQPNPETIMVFEGGGCARILGAGVLAGGAALAWSHRANCLDIAFLVGALLIVFGIALLTQRSRLTLNRSRGSWSHDASVFFVISLGGRGRFEDLGPVRITRVIPASGRHHNRTPIPTHPVLVAAKKKGGGTTDLRFGVNWSLEEARDVAAQLSTFLGKPVQDDSDKET
jgi:hypothetical protein